MNNESDKILPCPFCGGTKFKISNGIYIAKEAKSIKCLKCGTRSGYYMKRENVINFWNSRINIIKEII
jgi:Lar family restriction alleviation protein